jgi:hypothetical protein
LVTIASVVLLGVTAAWAQAQIPLNSERIEMRFGSYGLEVLQHDDAVRISNLHSVHGGNKVTRTFAVVSYPGHVHRALAAPHAEILAGGSIGAVLAAHGWQVNKHNRFIGTSLATPKLRAMMQSDHASSLATHVYLLEVERAGRRLDYALITEIHHPDYLSAAEVAAIYGRVPPLSAAARQTLEAALSRARRAAAE